MKHWLKYVVTLGCGLVVSFSLACILGLFQCGSVAAVYQTLSDSTLATGVILFGVGLLTFCGNHGAFDIIGFGLKNGLARLIPGLGTRVGKKTYAEYKEERAERKKSFGFLLLVGIFFLVLAVGFVILYMTA